MKTNLISTVLLLGFFISCKKDHEDAFAATRQKLLDKWNNTISFYANHTYGTTFYNSDTSHNGQYYNFGNDGQLSIYDGNDLATKPFYLENDTVILAGSGYDTLRYRIRILTDTSLQLYRLYVRSTHTTDEFTWNFKR